MPPGARHDHVDVLDRLQPAVDVVVTDEVDRGLAGDVPPDQIQARVVAVDGVGDHVATLVRHHDAACPGVARDLPAHECRLPDGVVLGRVGDHLPSGGLVDVRA